MWKTIDKYNAWYDALREPWRAGLLLVKVGIPSVLIAVGGTSVGWHSWAGFALIVCLLIIALRRQQWRR